MATFYPQTWEQNLLALAHPATAPAVSFDARPLTDPALLERAYAYCDSVTAEHSRSFHLASQSLPPEKRRAIRALYAFCRVSDNLVDCPNGDVTQSLAAWRQRALSPRPAAGDLIAVAWADTRLRYGIPKVMPNSSSKGWRATSSRNATRLLKSWRRMATASLPPSA